ADGYEAIMGRWSRRLAGPFLDFSGVPSRGRVLDAGCGTGSLTLTLAAHPDLAAIEALDFEENFVTALPGRTTDPRIGAQQGDVCALPYADAEFDNVYSLLVLHFVSDPHRAVREMRRVLRPGGTPRLRSGTITAACRAGACSGTRLSRLSRKQPIKA